MPQPQASSTATAPVRKGMKGLESVLTEIRKRRAKAQLDSMARTKVGYSAPHAVPVHERLDQSHRVGQAKYLQQPIRTEQQVMAVIIRKRLMGRASLKSAQLDAANHLMKVSLTLVPRDTGALASSWFIK